MKRTCARCGSALAEDDEFCGSCGQATRADLPPVVPPVPTVAVPAPAEHGYLPAPPERHRSRVVVGLLAAVALLGGGVLAGVLMSNTGDAGRDGPDESEAVVETAATSPSSGAASTVQSTTGQSTIATELATTTSIADVVATAGTPTAPLTAVLVPRNLVLTAPAITPHCVGETSEDASGNPVSFQPGNLVDGDLTTAWRCDGARIGTTFEFAVSPPATITAVGLVPGYAKIDPERSDLNRFYENRRIAAVTWSCRSGDSQATIGPQQLDPDRAEMQSMPLSTGMLCDRVSVRIDSVTEQGGNGAYPKDYTAISEVSIQGARP